MFLSSACIFVVMIGLVELASVPYIVLESVFDSRNEGLITFEILNHGNQVKNVVCPTCDSVVQISSNFFLCLAKWTSIHGFNLNLPRPIMSGSSLRFSFKFYQSMAFS